MLTIVATTTERLIELSPKVSVGSQENKNGVRGSEREQYLGEQVEALVDWVLALEQRILGGEQQPDELHARRQDPDGVKDEYDGERARDLRVTSHHVVDGRRSPVEVLLGRVLSLLQGALHYKQTRRVGNDYAWPKQHA